MRTWANIWKRFSQRLNKLDTLVVDWQDGFDGRVDGLEGGEDGLDGGEDGLWGRILVQVQLRYAVEHDEYFPIPGAPDDFGSRDAAELSAFTETVKTAAREHKNGRDRRISVPPTSRPPGDDQLTVLIR